jgi:hypothetical protein
MFSLVNLTFVKGVAVMTLMMDKGKNLTSHLWSVTEPARSKTLPVAPSHSLSSQTESLSCLLTLFIIVPGL